MRLATIIPENGRTPLAAVAVHADRFVSLHTFLNFFGVKELPENPGAPLRFPAVEPPLRAALERAAEVAA